MPMILSLDYFLPRIYDCIDILLVSLALESYDATSFEPGRDIFQTYN